MRLIDSLVDKTAAFAVRQFDTRMPNPIQPGWILECTPASGPKWSKIVVESHKTSSGVMIYLTPFGVLNDDATRECFTLYFSHRTDLLGLGGYTFEQDGNFYHILPRTKNRF